MSLQKIENNNSTLAFDPCKFDDFVRWIDRSEKTAKTYLCNLRQFAAWLAYMEITQPCRQDIINYRNWLSEEHQAVVYAPQDPARWKYRTDSAGAAIIIRCKPNTTALYLRSVCQFFAWLSDNGLYPNIANNIHAPKIAAGRRHSRDALDRAEVIEIEQSIIDNTINRAQAVHTDAKDAAGRIQRATEQGKRLHAIYLLSVTAGLRTIEISRANIKDFQSKGGKYWLYVWGKGHTEADQRKAIAPEVAEVIIDYLQSRTDKYNSNSPLFVSTGNRSHGKRIAPQTISTMLKSAMIDAGYNSERLTAHSLRHTAGTAAMQITGDLYAVQKYMRHSNPATTEIYLHTDADLQDDSIANDLYQYYHQAQSAQQAQDA